MGEKITYDCDACGVEVLQSNITRRNPHVMLLMKTYNPRRNWSGATRALFKFDICKDCSLEIIKLLEKFGEEKKDGKARETREKTWSDKEEEFNEVKKESKENSQAWKEMRYGELVKYLWSKGRKETDEETKSFLGAVAGKGKK